MRRAGIEQLEVAPDHLAALHGSGLDHLFQAQRLELFAEGCPDRSRWLEVLGKHLSVQTLPALLAAVQDIGIAPGEPELLSARLCLFCGRVRHAKASSGRSLPNAAVLAQKIVR